MLAQDVLPGRLLNLLCSALQHRLLQLSIILGCGIVAGLGTFRLEGLPGPVRSVRILAYSVTSINHTDHEV